MQAEVIGVGEFSVLNVATEPPASVEITFRPCAGGKPPEQTVPGVPVHPTKRVAYYAVVERRL